jgi:hypothetical protein
MIFQHRLPPMKSDTASTLQERKEVKDQRVVVDSPSLLGILRLWRFLPKVFTSLLVKQKITSDRVQQP